ncbi:hypothetical protein [Pedobacter nyackensis]|uniref:Uncharacterized protein n=1 Tax=Pedobacter nyackensis TaxID=475255 RepID=A0A1W1ZWB0_9SPHI|nr:hypothetical protein [Pedobacter nyackensis]SMC52522.1 hypothetical protein SAMN04488101_10191 [Pedobacter nyackensis]
MKPDLSKLPLRYQKYGKNWKDTKTGQVIHNSKITDYLPKTPQNHEEILAKRYDLNY